MPLDKQIQAVFKKQQELGIPSLETASIDEIRRAFSYSRSQLKEIVTPIATVVNKTITSPDGEIPIRIYKQAGTKILPVLVFFHGGGFVLGDLETTDNICRYLAHHAECIVVSVAYRLAPEHRYPAAVQDAYFTTKWVAENAESFGGDSARIAVGGESAGGNLAALTSLRARDQNGPKIIYQLLIYPSVHLTIDSPYCIECGNKYNLTRDEMEWFHSHYLENVSMGNLPSVSPLLAESLANLPATLVITAEFDPLRDDGEAYVKRLKTFGTEAHGKRYDGMVHSFLNYSGEVDQSRIALEEIAASLKRALYTRS